MDLDVAKKLINRYVTGHANFLTNDIIAERYYKSKDDILFTRKNKDETENPMRTADNRISMSFYPLLVDQKVSYLFTAPPVFDVHEEALNQLITDSLGDEYSAKVQQLAVESSNAGIGWLHYWEDENKNFQYAVVPSAQIIPVWSRKLDNSLLAVLRVYQDYDEQGELYDVYEYWNDRECETFSKRVSDTIDDGLMYFPAFTDFYNAGFTSASNKYLHPFGAVPFIPFKNNQLCTSDLNRIKPLIDSYDKTYSGFMNDLEDIQQVIFVLTNYGGEDLNQFLRDLKYFKVVSTDSAGGDDRSGVSTLTIDIPVEARDKMLEITRKAIFTMGQGVDPEQQGLDKTSGEAMKFVYSLLELKAGQTETQFRLGFNRLIRAILRHAGKTAGNIVQTWTRTAIKNDADLVNMCSNSVGIVSNKTILAHHPFVDDVQAEEEQMKKEQQEKADGLDPYHDEDDEGGEE